MDKEEFRVKLEEINSLVEAKDYEGAMKVVDSIDWRRVKNVRTLCVVGEIYAANKRYEDSREIFLLAYHRAPIGKNILYRLIEVSLKMGDVEEAEEYYEEFMEIAADDHTQYVLNYKILCAKNAPLEERIRVLEEYKEKEFVEKWSYELAKLYYQAGQKDKCLSVCNEMSLWFNEGPYVSKAMELKSRIVQPEEKTESDKLQDQPAPETDDTEIRTIESIQVKNEKELASVESIQEKISKGLRNFMNRKDTEEGSDQTEPEGFPDEDILISDDIQTEQAEQSVEAEKEKEEKVSESLYDDSDDFLLVEEEKEENAFVPSVSDTKNMPVIKRAELPGIQETEEKPEEIFEEEPNEPVQEKIQESVGEKPEEQPFNLEDSILAAASQQGIELPEEKETEEESPRLKEEEFLSEEDLVQAEKEFMNASPAQPIFEEIEDDQSDKTQEEKERKASYQEKKSTSYQEKENTSYQEKEGTSYQEKKSTFSDEEDFPMITEPEEESGAGYKDKEDLFEKPIAGFAEKPENEVTDEDDPYLDLMDEAILDIIPRERRLNEEEVKLFTYFVKVPGMKEQLLDTLCDVQDAASDKTSRTGNIIVMGGRETGKTRLISALIPAICSELNLEATKVAYVFAQDINGKDIAKIVDKLSGGFLVIEDANQLTLDTVNQLNKAMEFRTDGLIIILEDEKIGMRKMMARYPKFARKFTSLINIPVFTNDELVNFAIVYTIENGYKIDQMGMLALYNRIGENQKEDQPMNIGSVKAMLDAAIEKAEGGFLKINRKKRLDKDGFITLHEKDFA